MHIKRGKKAGERTIELQPDEGCIIFHRDGVTFDGMNPRQLAQDPEKFKKLLDMAPHLCGFFDAVEMIHARTTDGDAEPWDLMDDFNARN